MISVPSRVRAASRGGTSWGEGKKGAEGQTRRLGQIWTLGPDPGSNAPEACHNGNRRMALIGAF